MHHSSSFKVGLVQHCFNITNSIQRALIYHNKDSRLIFILCFNILQVFSVNISSCRYGDGWGRCWMVTVNIRRYFTNTLYHGSRVESSTSMHHIERTFIQLQNKYTDMSIIIFFPFHINSIFDFRIKNILWQSFTGFMCLLD